MTAPMTSAPPRSTTAVEVVVDHVSQVFGTGARRLVALDDVSLVAEAGRITSIVGPSGCGKSTLLDVVAGLVAPQSGSVRHGARTVAGTHGSVAMAFQQPALLPWLDVRDNVALGLRGRRVPRAEARRRVAPLLQAMGLGGFEQAYPHELSGGMAQRVGIARALAVEPGVLLMDEPYASVDAYTRVRLQEELLSTMRDRPTTVLFVTHDVGEAVYLGDRLVVMSPRPGRVVTTIDLKADASDRGSAYHAETVAAVLDLLVADDAATRPGGDRVSRP